MEPIDKQFVDKIKAKEVQFNKQDRAANTQKVLDKLDEIKPAMTQAEIAMSFLSMLRGPKGESPSEQELLDIITPLIPDPLPGEQGIAGPQGEDGKDSTVPGPQGEQGEKGEQGIQGEMGPQGPAGNDGSPDTADQIVEKLSTLKNAWLGVTSIKGFEEYMREFGSNFLNEAKGFAPRALASLYDVDVNRIANGQALIWDTTKRKFVPGAATGGGLTQLTATGAVDGVNAAFTFVSKPTYVVSDGAWYVENSGWTWNSGTLTATLSVPPQTGVFGFA